MAGLRGSNGEEVTAACKGLAPVRGRRNVHRQRCGAIAEHGITYCAAHAKAAGYRRCEDEHCSDWVIPPDHMCRSNHFQHNYQQSLATVVGVMWKAAGL